LNKQSQTVDKEWPPVWGLGEVLIVPCHKHCHCYETDTFALSWDWSFGTT